MKCLSEIPGNIVGKYWERLIFCKLKDAKIDYSYMDGVTPSRGTLNLERYEKNEDTRRNLQEIINDNNDSSMIVYCPNATDFDFVIFDGSGMIHAIQVTTETAVKKCRSSDFFKAENIHYKYLLTPREFNANSPIRSSSKFADAVNTYGLRMISAVSFLTKKELETFQFKKTS